MKKVVSAVRRFQDRAFVKFLAVKNFFQKKEEGASLVEYALLVALIALVAIVSVVALGTKVNNVFNNIVANLKANNVN